jgi:hypothetical protein
VLARSLEAANIRAAAIAPAVALPVSDTWGHDCAVQAPTSFIDDGPVLLDA